MWGDFGEIWLQHRIDRSVFLWGPGFPMLSRRIARRVSSSIWVVLDERTFGQILPAPQTVYLSYGHAFRGLPYA